jgi:hypothetical protein
MKIKHLLVGFVAGVLGLITLIFCVYLGLAIFGLFFSVLRGVIEAEAAGAAPLGHSAWQFVAGSLVGSVRNAVSALRSARLGLLVAGALGVIAAVGHQVGLLLRGKRAWLVSFILLAVGIAIPAITWAFVQREEVALWILETPEVYYWRELLLESYATEVIVTLIFALCVAYPIWAVWRWWYVKLVGWLLPGTRVFDPPEIPRLEQMLQSKSFVKWVSILFVICVIFLFPLHWYHDRIALHMQHGVAWVDDANQPAQSFVVEVRSDARKIRVVNINGLGAVSMYLSPTANYRQAVRGVEDWTFEWRLDEYLYTDLPMADVAPGEYYLHFVQESGWGYFEYTLGDGGGPASHMAALAFGFFLACSLLLGLGLVLLVAVRSGWIDVGFTA